MYNKMEFSVQPVHKHPEYLQKCCELINQEWKRSDTARLRSLESSCDQLPVSLILLKEKKLIGHLKLSAIPSITNGCFVESVVIAQSERGKGYGSILMKRSEEYCQAHLKLNVIYLSTKGQEGFYQKLGYTECKPISIYGSCTVPTTRNQTSDSLSKLHIINLNKVPLAPPMPDPVILPTSKTYMRKEL